MNAARAASLLCALPRLGQRLGAALRCQQGLELELLLGGEREQLVGGLAAPASALRRPGEALTRLGELDRVALHVLDDLRLDHHGLLKAHRAWSASASAHRWRVRGTSWPSCIAADRAAGSVSRPLGHRS